METKILEHLHGLASTLEGVGLAKYAEKVNDIFEKVADGELESAQKTLQEAKFLGGRTQQIEQQLAEQGVRTPVAPQAPARPSEAEVRQMVLSKIPEELRTQEGIRNWLSSGQTTQDQLKRFLDAKVYEYMQLTDPEAATSFAHGSSDLNQSLQWAKALLYIK